tara:strand:+ start:1637 stop:1894 length:258 start_codon:yes stop_codon:yes gene_type:complete
MNPLIVASLRHHITASAIMAVKAVGGVEILNANTKRELFTRTKGVLMIKVQQGESRPRIKGREIEIHLPNIVIAPNVTHGMDNWA